MTTMTVSVKNNADVNYIAAMVRIFLLFIAIVLMSLSITAAMSQSTYIITGSGTTFTATKNSTTVGTANQPIQNVIDAIKLDALGAACTIQFGSGTSTINTGAANITFDGGSIGIDWGLITLTGKLTSTCSYWDNGTVYLTNGASMNSLADITNTAGGDPGGTIFCHNSTKTLTISGGTLLTTSSSIIIYNKSTGTINITGGTVKATEGINATAIMNGGAGTINISGGTVETTGTSSVAVTSTSKGKITVSGNALIISQNTNSTTPGTIYISDNGITTGACLEITGGKVENTANNGSTIYNNSTGAIDINGGTVQAANGAAIYSNSTGKITVSGTTLITSSVSTIGGSWIGTIHLVNKGTTADVRLEITGGTVENTSNGITICNESFGIVNISGGTISGNYNGVVNNYCGILNISGGTIFSPTGVTIWNGGSNGGTINITGGTISTMGDIKDAILSYKGYINISGGTVSTTTGRAIGCNSSPVEINISGGTVSATIGNAIVNSYPAGKVNISGGIVSATTGKAIRLGTSGATTTISDNAIVFAYGTAVTDVIDGNYDQTDDAVVVVWDDEAGTTTYEAGTSDDIYKLPAAATAVWAKQGSNNGISVSYNTTIGFIPIADVTVGTIGIKTITNEQLRIYPNPTNGQLFIESKDLHVEKVDILDITGRVVLTSRESTVNISQLSFGTYFVKIKTNKGDLTTKIIKE